MVLDVPVRVRFGGLGRVARHGLISGRPSVSGTIGPARMIVGLQWWQHCTIHRYNQRAPLSPAFQRRCAAAGTAHRQASSLHP